LSLGGSILYSDWFAAADAEIALRSGDARLALNLAQQSAPAWKQEARLLALGLAEQVSGLALGHLEPTKIAEADAHLLAGLKIMEDSEQRVAAALLALEWAGLCRRRGSLSQAEELQARAVAQLSSFGCAHLIENG